MIQLVFGASVGSGMQITNSTNLSYYFENLPEIYPVLTVLSLMCFFVFFR